MQQLLVWKFILWISSPTVEKLDSIAGIQLVKRSLVVSEMVISKFLLADVCFKDDFHTNCMHVVLDHSWCFNFFSL